MTPEMTSVLISDGTTWSKPHEHINQCRLGLHVDYLVYNPLTSDEISLSHLVWALIIVAVAQDFG